MPNQDSNDNRLIEVAQPLKAGGVSAFLRDREYRWRFFHLILLLLVGIPAANGLADEYITQYRYRSFDGTTPPVWVSSYASGTVLPNIVKIERGTATDAFQQFWYASFNGNKRYVCADDVPGNDLSADFTVTAWINLNTTNGTQTICSTMDPREQDLNPQEVGFRFSVRDGHLTGEAWQASEGGWFLRTVRQNSVMETGRWHRVTFRRVKTDEDVFGPHLTLLDLWIDTNKVAAIRAPYEEFIQHSTLNPVFGAEPAGSGFTDYLNAKVYAIQVDDYGLSDFFLRSPIVRDGSRYFGMPSYHDYLGEGEANKPLERRVVETHENSILADFRDRLRDRWMFPFANDNYVPQGFTSDQEGHRIFAAMYWRDEDDNVGDYASIIAEILMPEGRLGNVFVLQDPNGNPVTSHVGGVLYLDGLLIVPNAEKLLVYDISPVPPATFNPDTFANFNPREIRAVQVVSNAFDTGNPLVTWDSIAFMDAFYAYTNAPGNSTTSGRLQWMLLGDYQAGVNVTNALYRVQVGREAGSPEVRLTGKRLQRQLTDNMQGAATYFAANSAMRNFQAGTGGSESRIMDACYTNFLTTSGIHLVQSNSPTIHVPQGLEQLTVYDGKLWSISESGARFFQKGTAGSAPWANCYPFFYSLDVQDRLDSNNNGMRDEWEVNMFGTLTTATVDGDLDKLSNLQEYLADTHPRNSNAYPNLQISRLPGDNSFVSLSFPASVLRFYTVESSSNLVTWTLSNRFLHRRGTDGIISATNSLAPDRATYFRIRVEDR